MADDGIDERGSDEVEGGSGKEVVNRKNVQILTKQAIC